jgi:hypothetical protein
MLMAIAFLVLLSGLINGCTGDGMNPLGPEEVPDLGSGTIVCTYSSGGGQATSLTFTGSGQFPPGVSGVIAVIDSSGTRLSIIGYAQHSTAIAANDSPAVHYDVISLDVQDVTGIHPGSYEQARVQIGIDVGTTGGVIDSFASESITGECIIASMTDSTISATFSGSGRGKTDDQVISVSRGVMEVSYVISNMFENSDDSGTGGTIRVQVGRGTTPPYSWEGGGIVGLQVFRVTGILTPVWAVVASKDTDGIASPVIHGSPPPGTVESVALEKSLTAGASYRVMVFRTNGESGFRDFVPSEGVLRREMVFPGIISWREANRRSP